MRLGRVLLLVAAAVTCGESTTPEPEPVETDQVTIVDNAFEPPDIQVEEGRTVTWTWTGNEPHTVIFDDPLLTDSDVHIGAGTHVVTFNTAGTYTYFCSVHGRDVMAGSVLVVAQAPQP